VGENQVSSTPVSFNFEQFSPVFRLTKTSSSGNGGSIAGIFPMTLIFLEKNMSEISQKST
jgi:hypothetical protein